MSGCCYAYKFDTHRGIKTVYPAICQRYDKVTAMRDGDCQTLAPEQRPAFCGLAKSEAKRLSGTEWDNKVSHPVKKIRINNL